MTTINPANDGSPQSPMEMVAGQSPWVRNRLIAAPVFAVTVGVLAVAAWLTPSAQGMGTHRQLGLPPCGFLMVSNIPCATCGMTTSFSHAAHGQFVQSFTTQPAGFLLSLATAVAAILSSYALVSGMSLEPVAQAVFRPRVLLFCGLMVLLSWGYTITTHALAVNGGS